MKFINRYVMENVKNVLQKMNLKLCLNHSDNEIKNIVTPKKGCPKASLHHIHIQNKLKSEILKPFLT